MVKKNLWVLLHDVNLNLAELQYFTMEVNTIEVNEADLDSPQNRHFGVANGTLS